MNGNRLNRLREWLPCEFDAAIVETPVNRYYFSDFTSSAGTLVVTREKAVLVVDGRYLEAARQTARGCEVRLGNRQSDWMPQLMEELSVRRALTESSIPVSLYRGWQELLPQIELISDGSLDRRIGEQRAVKDAAEVLALREAQRLTDEAFLHILEFVREGVAERDIAIELEFTMRRLGAQKESFETIAVSGERGALPHGVPGTKRVKKGEFVTMDFGAVVDGYHADMTRTIAVGGISDEQRLVYETVLEAQLAALATIHAGIVGSDADAAARRVIDKGGYGEYFDHSTGHGVGLEVHEAPSLAPRYDKPLLAGQVVTVEPGIYLPGRFGVRIEDFVLVTAEGCDNLTRSPKELIVL